MINLLPPEIKSQITYARKNARLIRFIVASVIGLILIGVVTAGGTFVITSAEKNLRKTMDNNLANESSISVTEEQVDQLSDQIKAISAVLSREVQFSDIIRYMGGTLPQGTILTNLSLGEKLTGTLTIDVASTNYDSVAIFRQNIDNYGKENADQALFSKADINSVSCDDPTKTQTTPTVGTDDGGIDKLKYPCVGKLTATFINKTATASTEGASQ